MRGNLNHINCEAGVAVGIVCALKISFTLEEQMANKLRENFFRIALAWARIANWVKIAENASLSESQVVAGFMRTRIRLVVAGFVKNRMSRMGLRVRPVSYETSYRHVWVSFMFCCSRLGADVGGSCTIECSR